MSAALNLTPDKAKELQDRIQRTRQQAPLFKLHPINTTGVPDPTQENIGAQITGAELASAMGLELIKDQHGSLRAKHMAGNRLAFPLIDSADVVDLVTENWLEKHGAKGLKTGVETAMTKLRIAAKASTKKLRTMVRVGSRASPEGHRQYLLDLGRADGQMVVSDHTGWVLEKNTTEAFLLPDGECALPCRFDSPEAAYEYVEQFKAESGVPEDLWLLACAAVVSMLLDDTAYIVLECCGPSGAGKTTYVNAIVQAIDPSGSGRPVNTGLNKRDVAAASSRRRFFVIDNASSLRREDQDLVCQIPYGVTMSERELYSNFGVASINVHCPILITSINPCITATDLQTRRLLIPFSARQNYAQDVQSSETDRGMLLGAFLTLLVAGLQQQRLSSITESKHRMAQFAAFGEALSRALGHENGHFSNLYVTAKQSAARDYADGDPTAFAIDKFLREQEKYAVEAEKPPKTSQIRKDRGFIIHRPDGTYFAGYTPKGLRLGANRINISLPYDERVYRSAGYTFPETDRAMGGAMNRLISSILPDLGFEMYETNLGSERNKEKLYLFEWREEDA